ncbi:ABC transporter permease [Colwellia sp. MSW7]|uniref:ABC transporter permease n=1 Tax=Colwellia maritima TaxID=2912588 RepID=A0ABS9X461_9GAMM|nr:ABC transporter permease [Colwellia maritima]MCI2285035.1 ABC transporter permease [Colwellia maritima]
MSFNDNFNFNFSYFNHFNANFIKIDILDAWQCLMYRKVRTILSALGIAIGTIALVSMIAIGDGAKKEALRQILSMGITTVRVENKVTELAKSEVYAMNQATGLTLNDINRLKVVFSHADIGAFIKIEAVPIVMGDKTTVVDIIYANIDWIEAESLSTTKGRLLNEVDNHDKSAFCNLGANVFLTNRKFNVGDSIHWKNEGCSVIGKLSQKEKLLTEGTALSAIDFNNSVLLPISLLSNSVTQLSGITLHFQSSQLSQLEMIGAKVSDLLQMTHRGIIDFNVVIPAQLLEKSKKEQEVFTLIMSAIAGLSLLVGGIGIMNVMLAHVAEQTREIGLRIAVGATNDRIITLFLAYSLLITVVGSLSGVVGGVILALLIEVFVRPAC